ncbi:MAG: hypothetical protein LQ340_004611 [Diploschistes diacapsis]|nr:MAG: hypothetical protein LQ340_004611 [Diploschistes diacapsis]
MSPPILLSFFPLTILPLAIALPAAIQPGFTTSSPAPALCSPSSNTSALTLALSINDASNEAAALLYSNTCQSLSPIAFFPNSSDEPSPIAASTPRLDLSSSLNYLDYRDD